MSSRGKSWHYRCRNRVYIKHHHHDNHHNLIYIVANNIVIARIYRFCDSPTSDNIVDTYASSHPVARERLRRGGSGCRCCARCLQRQQAAATGAWSALWAYPRRVAASTHLSVLWQFFCIANTFYYYSGPTLSRSSVPQRRLLCKLPTNSVTCQSFAPNLRLAQVYPTVLAAWGIDHRRDTEIYRRLLAEVDFPSASVAELLAEAQDNGQSSTVQVPHYTMIPAELPGLQCPSGDMLFLPPAPLSPRPPCPALTLSRFCIKNPGRSCRMHAAGGPTRGSAGKYAARATSKPTSGSGGFIPATGTIWG